MKIKGSTSSDITEEKIKNLIDIENKDENGNTPLHMAAFKGHTAGAKLLLAKGANVEAINNHKQTPLHLAALNGQKEVVSLLLKEKANIESLDNHAQTALHVAASRGHTEVVNVLLEEGANINAIDDIQYTSLHMAAFKGHTEVAELLLEKGANIEAKIKNQATSLYLAASRGHTKVVKLLLEKGVNIEDINSLQATPLHEAASEGHTKVVQLLLKKGANIEARDSQGYTPLHVAACKGNKKIVELLINNSAKTTDLFNAVLLYPHMSKEDKVDMLKFLFKLGITIETSLDNINLDNNELALELKDIVNDALLVNQIQDHVKYKLLAATNTCQGLIAERLETILKQEGLSLDYTNYKEYIENIDESKLSQEIKQNIIKFIKQHQEDISVFATSLLTECFNKQLLPLNSYTKLDKESKEFYTSIATELGNTEVNNLFDQDKLKPLSQTSIQKIIDNFNVQVINKYFADYITIYGIDLNINSINKLILPCYLKNNITTWIKAHEEFTANPIANTYREHINTRLQEQEQKIHEQKHEIKDIKNSNQQLQDRLQNLEALVKNLISANSRSKNESEITINSSPKNKM